MTDWQERTLKLIGEKALERLRNAHILVVGVGGVGGYAAEMLARSGIGNLTICDGDIVDITNINRQIIATQSSVGQSKVEIFCARALDINPSINIRAIKFRFNRETSDKIFDKKYDYIIDAIDSIQDKVDLIVKAKSVSIPIISAMGAGNRVEISDFEITDIFKTSNDGLAKKIRKMLRDANVSALDVVATNAPAIKLENTVGSIAYMPALCGIKLGAFVVKKLIDDVQ